MNIKFRKITEFPRGTLATLLIDGYSFEPKFEEYWLSQWQEFDNFFYDNPHIAESCGFMTVLNGEPIGFVTWHPSMALKSAEIGHNCISTEYKGNGYGKFQMREAVRRIIEQGATKITVCTNERLIAAQRAYESVGFKFIEKSEEPNCPEFAGNRIHYELIIK